jgi:hypothetical protein
MVTGEMPRRDGKRHPIGLSGKPAPGWLTKYTQSGKTSLVYFVMGGFSSSRGMGRLAIDLKNKYGGIHVTGVLFEADQRHLWGFLGSLGKRVNHQIKLDKDLKAVREGKLPGVPAIFVVDSGGKVTYSEVGYFGETTKEELQNALK